MKNKLIFFATIMATLFSCDKGKEVVSTDEILFSDLDHAITASTVRYWDIEDRGICVVDLPVPADSSTSILIDINRDNENDFLITLSHTYVEPTDYCGHCSVYRYDINIHGIHESNSIACAGQSSIPLYFSNSDTITIENDWCNDAILIMKNRCAMISFGIEAEYIGFKHNNQIGWIKLRSIPNNGLTIENFAVNLTDKQPILAGQTE